MIDDADVDAWFCCEVLPLERPLLAYIRRNWCSEADVPDFMHDIYAAALNGASKGLPNNTRAYLYAIAKHHLIRKGRRAQIVSIDLIADLETVDFNQSPFAADHTMQVRDELRRALSYIESLPPRCRQAVYLRKVEGLTTKEAADRMGVGISAIEQHLTRGMRLLTEAILGEPTAPAGAPASRSTRREHRR